MSTLEFDINSEPRRGFGWLCLALIVGGLIFLQNYAYFTRPVETTKYGGYDQLLRMTVLERQSLEMLRTFTGGAQQVAVQRAYDTAISDLAPLRKTDARASRLYVAMRKEQGKEIVPEDISILQRSKQPEDRAFAALYAPGDLSKDQIDPLLAAIPKDSKEFVWTMAKVHGMERAGDKEARSKTFPVEKLYGFTIATSVVVIGVCCGFLLWPAYFVLRQAGKLKPLGHPSGMLPMPDADRYALRVAQILLMMPLISLGAAQLFHVGDIELQVISASILLAAVLVVLSLPIFGKKISVALLGLHSRDFGKNVLWGLAGVIANAPVLLFMAGLGQQLFRGLPEAQHPVTVRLQGDHNTTTVMILLFVASVLAPIIEEIVFRGHLLPAMASAFRSIPIGIAASSLVFAAIHPTGVPAWLPLAWIGAMNAMLTYQTRSLVPAMVLHAIHNFATLSLVLLLF